MIRAIIKKLDGTQLDHGNFASQEAALAWFQPLMDKGIYGPPAIYRTEEVLVAAEVRGPVQVLTTPAEYNEFGEEITPPLYSIDPDGVISEAVYETQSFLESPAQFTIEFIDVSQIQKSQDEINAEAIAYLLSTDWYATREFETGVAIPTDIRQARAAARAAIVR